jgi:N-formylglutamate deformylase
MSFVLQTGASPLLVSMPHVGIEFPDDLRSRYVPQALDAEDADWHLPRLYEWVSSLGATVLHARYSRYVIDLNRPPDDAPMYPGASNTELCPTRFFNGEPLYRAGEEPGARERERRKLEYWQPYHAALQGQIDRIRDKHGFVLLWDAHSIRSEIPWLFDGVLPDLNIGTAGGASAHATITQAVADAAARRVDISRAVNGRFKGGYITRHYGDPSHHVHAVQLEMCQKLYMSEQATYGYEEVRAAAIRPLLENMVGGAVTACKALYAR